MGHSWDGQRGAVLLLCVATCFGCRKQIDKPTPPNLLDLVKAYGNPQGTFDQATANDVVDAVNDVLAQLNDLGLTARVQGFLTDIENNVQSTEPENETQGEVDANGETIVVEGEAFVEIERICNGWGPMPKADKGANGFTKLNVNVTDAAVDPIIWATTDSCRYLENDVEVLMDRGDRDDIGDLRMFIGENLTLGNPASDPVLLEVDIKTSIGGSTTERINFDVKLDLDGGFKIRIPVGDGDLVVGTTQTDIITVEAGNGDFTCDVDVCTNDAGASVQL